MDSVNSNHIQAMIDTHIDKSVTRYTDEAPIYKGIAGYKQRMVHHSVGAVNTNGIESAWALLKRGYHGTFHH